MATYRSAISSRSLSTTPSTATTPGGGVLVGREGDFVTSPHVSSVFSFTLGKLVREFVSRAGDDLCTIVDIGCGDGKLIRELSAVSRQPSARFIGVDRTSTELRTIDEIPRGGAHLIFSNELFDALPFARLVKRGDDLHELWVDENFEWTEHEAEPRYRDYFESRGIELADGQFADVSLEWEALYDDISAWSTAA